MEKIEMTMRKRFGKMYDVFLGEMYLFTASKLVAEPICGSFNEHDALKDKEALLDEVIKRFDALMDGYETVTRIGKDSFVIQSLITTLSKYKEIK